MLSTMFLFSLRFSKKRRSAGAILCVIVREKRTLPLITMMIKNKEESIVYFNNAGMARFRDDVKQAGMEAVSNQMDHDPTTVPRIRELFADLIEADSSQIALMPSTAFAITLAAKNLERFQLSQDISGGENQKILVLQDQMCSAVYPWQDISDRSNGRIQLEIVPYPEKNESWTELVLERLRGDDQKVAVVCLPPLHWADGALLELVAIGNECREKTIPLIVDATQAVGASTLESCSVRLIRPALLACSAHKWLRGPSGTSLVYIDPELHEQWLPLDQHGRGRDLAGGKDWDASKNEMGPNGYPEKFFKDARKFDSGGKPNPILLPMLRASLECVAALDKKALQSSLKESMEPFLEWVKSSPAFSLPPAHDFHLFGVRPTNMTPDRMIELCNRLADERRIYVAVRCGAFRISPYIDNSKADVDALLSAFMEMERNGNSSCTIQ